MRGLGDGLELVVWVIAGAVALCGTLSVAELATMMPQTGGVYVFVRRAYGERTAFVLGWIHLLVATPASIGLDAVPHGIQWFAIVFIAILTAVTCAPVRANGAIAAISALVKILTLGGIAVAGFVLAGHAVGPSAVTDHGAAACPDVPQALRGTIGGFTAALVSASYAYGGWVNITSLGGEIRNPARALPRAMFVAVVLVIGLYVFANAAFIRTLGYAAIQHLSPSQPIGVVAARVLFGPGWARISSALLFVSILATLHVAILATSRITFALANDGLVFSTLGRVSRHGVPTTAVIGTSTIAVVLVSIMGFERISDYYVFNSWLILALTVAGLIVLRRREPDALRPYRVSGYPLVPLAFLILVAYVLVETTITKPGDTLIALAIAGSGLPAYAIVSHNRGRREAAPS